MRATYNGVRTQVAEAYVNVTVERNQFQPQFTSGEYRKEILENFPLGESILQVSANDRDVGVSVFFIPFHENFANLVIQLVGSLEQIWA